MICYNCGKCFTPPEVATLILNDENENILVKKILCYECAKLLALALIRRGTEK